MVLFRYAALAALMPLAFCAAAQRVTVHAEKEPAPAVFRTIVEQSGKNFVYSSDILQDMTVTVDADRQPLKKVLSEIFDGTDIEFKIKGKDVILKKRPAAKKKVKRLAAPALPVYAAAPDATMLDELVVLSRLEAPQVETAELGARKVTADEVRRMPALFGESDVIKALQTQPGVVEGTEGMAGMYVHGGNADENLYMLDNVPLYQVNHFGGLFSAFNTDIIRYIDFFKSSMPAKYDGRLSSFMDVRLMNGNAEGHHGTARLGLTSGAFNISGPIGGRTTYLVGLRRSWYDVLSLPMLAIINSQSEGEKIRFNYYFMDLNAKIYHRFSAKMNGFVSVYYGDDYLKTGDKDTSEFEYGWSWDDKYNFHWGNFVAQAGLNYKFNSLLKSEFTVAYTRYFSSLNHDEKTTNATQENTEVMRDINNTDNNINDWIFRGDFDWQPTEASRVRFGANYIRHSFLPARSRHEYIFNGSSMVTRDSLRAYGANEVNAYIEDDWKINASWRVNAGVHASLFNIAGKVKWGVSPRLSVSYRPARSWAVKAAYSRTTQYVHQLAQSYMALPTDQWIPITGAFKPLTADKIAVGGYWQSADKVFAASVEAYYKWMHNLIEYRDEYYLRPPLEVWDARLTSGRGTAKGIDFKFEKQSGKLTGHIAYSLAWTDRTFAEKNNGVTYPARFDNRHTINIVVNWNINRKVQLSAAWTGHSGNRYTLMPQVWEGPNFGGISDWGGETALRTPLNNYQLPFYHRLDLSCTVRNSRGYWTFGLYNAYCHMNTIAVRYGMREFIEQKPEGSYYVSRPVFQKVKLLPVIPSISYTWQF